METADETGRSAESQLDSPEHEAVLLPSADDIGSVIDLLHWMALLKSVSGFELYYREYGSIEISGVVEFSTLNRYFPRSIFFYLKES